MRVAIIADIHGNLPATEAVLDDISKQGVDHIVAAGDLALRGAHPAETVDLLFDRCHSVILGNTDAYIAGNYLSGAYKERDHWKTDLLEWTRDQMGSERVAKLGALPFSARYSPRKGQDLFVCHANPKNLEESLDPTMDDLTLRKYFNNLEAAACAFGHLHFPYRRRLGKLLIADVASVGIPRDGDLRPAYGLFTFLPTGWRVQIRRVRYPVKKATQALTARKVPGGPLLIHKLVEGRYRHHTALLEAARRHSGLPPTPFLRPPPNIKFPRPPEPGSAAQADPNHEPSHEPAVRPGLPHPAMLLQRVVEHALPDELPESSTAPEGTVDTDVDAPGAEHGHDTGPEELGDVGASGEHPAGDGVTEK